MFSNRAVVFLQKHISFNNGIFNMQTSLAIPCTIINSWVHKKCNNITKFCYQKLQNSQDSWYCKKCIKQILPFSELTASWLNMVTKENLISSPKKIIQKNNLTFLNDEYGTSVNNDYLIPDKFYKEIY